MSKYPIDKINMDKLAKHVRAFWIAKVARKAGITREGLSRIINRIGKRTRVNPDTFEAVVYAIAKLRNSPLSPKDYLKAS